MTQHSVRVDEITDQDAESLLITMRKQTFERERRQVVKVFSANNAALLEAQINDWLMTYHPEWDVEQVSLTESIWDTEGINWMTALVVFKRVLVRAG